MPGIYRIINKTNGHMYIGKTKGDFKRRWYSHVHSLRKGTSPCTILQRAWTKYKEESFEMQILVEGDFTPQELKQWEEIYIKLYGYYNVLSESRVTVNTKEHSEKLSKALTAAWAEGRRVGKKTSPSWERYDEVKDFWRDKHNGQGGCNHPGHKIISEKFNLTTSVAKRMIAQIKKDQPAIIEAYSRDEIYTYWLDPTNANQAKYKHPGWRDISRTFHISERIAKSLIKEFNYG